MKTELRILQAINNQSAKLIWFAENNLDAVNLLIAIANKDLENILSYSISLLIPELVTVIFPEI